MTLHLAMRDASGFVRQAEPCSTASVSAVAAGDTRHTVVALIPAVCSSSAGSLLPGPQEWTARRYAARSPSWSGDAAAGWSRVRDADNRHLVKAPGGQAGRNRSAEHEAGLGCPVENLLHNFTAVRGPAHQLEGLGREGGDEHRKDRGSQGGRGHQDKPRRPGRRAGRLPPLLGQRNASPRVWLKRTPRGGEHDAASAAAKSSWPTLRSSPAMGALTEGCAMRSAPAARLKLPCWATSGTGRSRSSGES